MGVSFYRNVTATLLPFILVSTVPAFAQTYRVAIVSFASVAKPLRVHVEFGSASATADPQAWTPAPYVASTPPPAMAPAHGRIGDRRSFWVQYNDPTHPSAPQWNRVSATLEYTTEHTDLWVDDDLSGLMDARFEKASQAAENAWQSQRERFGSLSYTTTDVARHPMDAACGEDRARRGSVPAFLPSRGELLSMLVVAPGKTKVGYADVGSFSPEAAMNCTQFGRSNDLPGLIVLPLVDGTLDPSDNNLLVAPAHELQHLKYYVRHKIRGTSRGMQMSLLNEGLSVLAQDFAAEQALNEPSDLLGSGYLMRTYLADPNAVSLVSFFYSDGSQSHPFGPACYGGAYLLQYYLYKRFGASYLDRVTDTQEDGLQAMADALPVPFPSAMREFGEYVLEATRKMRVRALPGTDFTMLGGSVSTYDSAQPVASVRADGSPVVWAELPLDSP